MKSLARLALLAGILPLPAFAALEHPVTADVYREMLRLRGTPGTTHAVPFSEAALGTSGLLAQMLQDPASPYSELVLAPAFTNDVWWPELADRVAEGLPFDATLQSMQWQLGLTKARPGIDVDVSAEQVRAFRGREAAASAVKAGISPQVFTTALDRHASRISIAAKEAVAVMLLGEQMAANPRDRWEAMNIRGNLHARYTVGSNRLPVLSDEDDEYLMSLVTAAIASGTMSVADGVQQLPAAYRVARAAAAYRDATGYVSSRPLCAADAPAPGHSRGSDALAEPALCFVAATDRGVLGWYREEIHREHERLRNQAARSGNHDKTGLLTLLGIALPVLDVAALVEAAELSVATEIAETSAQADAAIEADAAAARSSRLICGVRAR
ncbi:hypothetical protein [Luteibacter sp.]|uniref:hypothetical protein n=1 Tax=Luteibacter sp. TaxID=1886636 RepID=UPI003F810A0F